MFLKTILRIELSIFDDNLLFDVFVNYFFKIRWIKQISNRSKLLTLSYWLLLPKIFIEYSNVLIFTFSHKVRQELRVDMSIYFDVLQAFLLNAFVLKNDAFFNFIFKFLISGWLQLGWWIYDFNSVESGSVGGVVERICVKVERVILLEKLHLIWNISIFRSKSVFLQLNKPLQLFLAVLNFLPFTHFMLLTKFIKNFIILRS